MTGGRRVLIADDHPPTRAGVRHVLEKHGFEVCAEVGDATAAVDAAVELSPDICLLDIHMPGSGIRATRVISTRVPASTVVMLTVSQDDRDLFDALRAGAVGYLLKDMDADRLPIALEGVLGGEAALPRALAARVINEFHQHGSPRHPRSGHVLRAGLTSRESEVLNLMAEGLSTAEIAERLFVSKVTVRTHAGAVLKKLGVSTREEAVRAWEVPG